MTYDSYFPNLQDGTPAPAVDRKLKPKIPEKKPKESTRPLSILSTTSINSIQSDMRPSFVPPCINRKLKPATPQKVKINSSQRQSVDYNRILFFFVFHYSRSRRIRCVALAVRTCTRSWAPISNSKPITMSMSFQKRYRGTIQRMHYRWWRRPSPNPAAIWNILIWTVQIRRRYAKIPTAVRSAHRIWRRCTPSVCPMSITCCCEPSHIDLVASACRRLWSPVRWLHRKATLAWIQPPM